METILITGGSGLIGSALSELLTENGYSVRHLSRDTSSSDNKYPTYFWDYTRGIIDPDALHGVDHIIHLAGAGIADKRWTATRKQDIVDSRVQTLNLIYDSLQKQGLSIKSLISASGSNFYGYDSTGKLFEEQDSPGEDFLAQVCVQWETAALRFQSLTRVSILRTSMVLSPTSGALEKLIQPIKFGLGAPLGTGNQNISWIHLNDLTAMYLFILKNAESGIFNASAGNDTNQTFTKVAAQVLKKPLFLPSVPGFILRLYLGELAQLVLNGNALSSKKIQQAGFSFQFPELKTALTNLLKLKA